MMNETLNTSEYTEQTFASESELQRQLELLRKVYQAAGLPPTLARDAALADLASLLE